MPYSTENYGKAVEFTDTQGHTVRGTIRWEDSHGAKMDIPGRAEGLYVSNAFLRRSF